MGRKSRFVAGFAVRDPKGELFRVIPGNEIHIPDPDPDAAMNNVEVSINGEILRRHTVPRAMVSSSAPVTGYRCARLEAAATAIRVSALASSSGVICDAVTSAKRSRSRTTAMCPDVPPCAVTSRRYPYRARVKSTASKRARATVPWAPEFPVHRRSRSGLSGNALAPVQTPVPGEALKLFQR